MHNTDDCKNIKQLVTQVMVNCALLSTLLVSHSASSNNYLNLTFEELSNIEISIATGNSTPIYKAPAIASVITAEDIKAMSARTIDDVLELIPGLHISRTSLNRVDSVYSIRGIHTNFNPHVLILLNGVPVQWSVQVSRPLLFRFPVTAVDRIEVIRGPGSAIYGADAYSGVINIITKQATATTATNAGARVGSFDTTNTWLQHNRQLGIWNFNITLDHQHSNGDPNRHVDSDFQTSLDNQFSTQASLAPGALSTRYNVLNSHINLNRPQWNLNFWSWNSQDAGNGAGGSQALDPYSGDDFDIYMMDITYQNNNYLNWNHKVRVSYGYYNNKSTFKLLPNGAIVPIDSTGNLDLNSNNSVLFPDGFIGNPAAKSYDSQLGFVTTYTGLNQHSLRFGIGVKRQSVDTSETKNFGPGVIDGTTSPISGTLTDVSNTEFVYLPNNARTVSYVTLQDEWQLAENWQLVAGLRYDYYSDFGDTTNPRMALIWETHDELTTKLLYGSAFRVPSFSEIGFTNNPATIGNPNLRPETIDTYELSFNYRPQKQLQTNLNLFYYRAKGLIEFTPVAENIRNQEGMGIEWEVDWRYSNRWRLQANAAWQASEDMQSGATVADAPSKQFSLISHWQVRPQWFLNSRVNWVGGRHREAGDTRANIDDYTIVDFTLQRQQLLPSLDIGLSIRNAFNSGAREPSNPAIPNDILLEGRSLEVELQYTFD